ncbi:MAG TPA: RagB/SusD family nutrient uptake outer membrane protein [Puia sp.]|nr:RagB/SusD family nutrient uptake outer membrane protein [Puia sp.]
MRYNIVPGGLFLIMAVTSCSKKFVTLYPQGQLNEGVFYKTNSDFQQAVTGAYTPLRDAANVAFYLEEMRADNTFFDYNAKDRGGTGNESVAEFLDDATNSNTQTLWAANFQGIQWTDIILDKLAQSTPSDMSDSSKNQIIGQAKALRAHYYFELVRLFGPLPLYLHEVTDAKNAIVNRSPVDSVYAQIIADFTDALSKLSTPAFPQLGTINKGMVATELGLVYLTLKQYDKATPLFQSVTTMGYSLLPDYASVFKTANENSVESIFEIQYSVGNNTTPANGTVGANDQSSQFVYDFIPNMASTLVVLGVDYNNTAGSWNVPTQNLVTAYESGDARLDASVGVIKGHLNSTTDFLPDSVVSILNNIDTSGKGMGYTTSLTHRFIRKQYNYPYTGVTQEYNTGDDWYVYRYSDLLLMLAESLNEQGQSGAALPYLNQVRQRAGLQPIMTTDQSMLRDTIAHERRVELAFENHRWFDLVRTGQAIPVMTAYGIMQKQAYPFLLPNSYNVVQTKLIYGIPSRDVMVNPGLGQNPGY